MSEANFVHSTNKMYTIKQSSKTLGFQHNNNHYIIGFDNVKLARKIQYSLHPYPEMKLLRGTNQIDLKNVMDKIGCENTSLIMDLEATLFLPKFKGSSNNPLNDGGYHLNVEKYEDFVAFPFTKMLGVVMPISLTYEDENEFVLLSNVIEPTFHPKLFG